ncbi:MAG: nicotinate phosphoribosyltransferase [Erysipelotrichales bacterium]|nr:nicotinate phosphoribosyltransferase [Erysipelotrichales bacterium]
MAKERLALLADFYEFTMMNGYFKSGKKDVICYYDVFFRNIPDRGGFALFCGLESIIKYIQELKFTSEEIDYLRKTEKFSEEFLDYLKAFRFTGDIYSVAEGTPIFPNEPIMTIRAKALEAQLIETFILLSVNHQSLICTKANRIFRSADNRAVTEFGARRAHGPSAAVLGARAAYIGGFHATSNTSAAMLYNIPLSGTMAHSWIQMFNCEIEAFSEYLRVYPDNAILLIDTYNTLKSGVVNAVKAFNSILKPLGKRPFAVRIDSGDITYLSKKVRHYLDTHGYKDCKIIATNSLDEYTIDSLIRQGAEIDVFGVGEKLITAKSDSVFGGVYKLVAVEEKDAIIPKIKISENVEKITTPHFKKLYRLFSKEDGKPLADLLCTYDETIDDSKPLEIFDPISTWKRQTLTNFYAKELLMPIFKKGKLVYQSPTIDHIREMTIQNVESLWDEMKRFDQPHRYYVDLSQRLWDVKNNLLNKAK